MEEVHEGRMMMDKHALVTACRGCTPALTEDATRRSAALDEVGTQARAIRDGGRHLLPHVAQLLVRERLDQYIQGPGRAAIDRATDTSGIDRMEQEIENDRARLLGRDELLWVTARESPGQLADENRIRDAFARDAASGMEGKSKIMDVLTTTTDPTVLRAALLDPSPEGYAILSEDEKAQVLETVSRRRFAESWASLDTRELNLGMIQHNAATARDVLQQVLNFNSVVIPGWLPTLPT